MGEIILTNGSRLKLFSADQPDRFRGPQHHGAWCDELAAYRYTDAWDQLQFGLRLGDKPRIIVTTTPKPVPLIKSLASRTDGSVAVTRGSTFDNAANLAPSALLELQARYAGTRLGRQELFGDLLADVPGALWTRDMIEQSRVQVEPPLVRIVIGVDPAVTSGESSDSTGIVVAGATPDGHFYIIEDSTIKATPEQWASKVAVLFEKHKADRVIAEVNNGGDLVSLVLRNVNPNIPIKTVNASRGKRVRAEPISAMYEQFRVHHVGYFAELEDQMCEWTPDSNDSPDNLDAMVWALTELSSGNNAMMSLASLANFCPNCRMPVNKQSAFCPSCNTPMMRE
jgi:predicted phage terminase large subunit-like protein